MSANEGMVELLESVADQLGVKVSYEALAAGSAGGLCRVKGEYRLIVDKRAPLGDRLATLAQGLAQLDWSALDLPTAVRARLERYAPADRQRRAS
jgi:hypothetical protein